MELVMTEWVQRRNLLTTKHLTVYDFIDSNYMLLGECPEEIAANAFRDGHYRRIKWTIGFHNEN